VAAGVAAGATDDPGAADDPGDWFDDGLFFAGVSGFLQAGKLNAKSNKMTANRVSIKSSKGL
jgi:hypothetical protein